MPKMVERITELSSMKDYPSELYYSGELSLLKKKKISIVGTRKPSKYSREQTLKLASLCKKYDVCVVSGGAMGIDAIAHSGAGCANTIAVLPCGIDLKYPSINKNLLSEIEKEGLLLSQFKEGFKARPWSFVTRNELVVALGDVLVVGEADMGSGSMRSVEFALEMGKEIYVFPQRLGESKATNKLLENNNAKAIYDLEGFVSAFSGKQALSQESEDPFLKLCRSNPSYDEVFARFPQRVFEAELSGEIEVVNGKVLLK